MTKFTPGEWRVDPTGDVGPGLIGTSEKPIAEVYTGDSSESEWMANAALIAAAPELLEALATMVDYALSPDFDGAPSNAALLQAQRAILKATSVREPSAASTPPGNPKSVAATAKNQELENNPSRNN